MSTICLPSSGGGGAGSFELLDPSLPPYNAPTDGVTDATAAINAALDALTPGQALWVGSGLYRINTSITLRKNGGGHAGGGVSRILGNGIGDNRCGFVAGMTDGSAVLVIPDGWDYGHLEGFSILTRDNLASLYTGMHNGTWTNQNAKGIANAAVVNYSRDFVVSRVLVRGLKVGFSFESFILDLENLYAYQCELGYKISSFNGSRAFLRGERNYKDLDLDDSAGSEFLLMFEAEAGFALANNSLSSTVDGIIACRFTMYLETAGTGKTNPWMVFGGTTLCQALDITNTGGGQYAALVPGLKFDRVNGITVRYPLYTQGPYGFFETTANSRNVFDVSGGNTTETPAGIWLVDNSKTAGNARNLWPNPNFDHWLGGWAEANAVTNLTISKETAIVRKGPHSMKLMNNSAAVSLMQFRITEPQILNAIKGRSMMIGAWVYLPANTYAGGVLQVRPTISIQSFNGVSSVYNNGNNTSMRGLGGQWNFMVAECAIQSDITNLYFYISPVESIAGVCPADYTIYVDSIVMADATVGDVMMRLYPLPDAGCVPKINGGLLEYSGNALPTHASLFYNKGDRFWDTGVAAGGSPGSICTTAGTGNAAVFKAMAGVAA